MTKYLTTYEELKANLGKKIKYTDTTCGEAKYEGFIKFDLRGNIYCNYILLTKKDTKEILPNILAVLQKKITS